MGNLAMYATKGFEYLLILGFLTLFTAFYLYFTSHRFEKARAVVSASIDQLVDWFRVPENVLFHQAHTWARPEETEPAVVKVGMDDFAQKMAGPMTLGNMPEVGEMVRQGDKGWTLKEGGKSVDMLMPVSGRVVEVNRQAQAGMEAEDPYERGWILKVQPDDFERESKGLLRGGLARKWMDGVEESLRARMSPELGAVLQDGGVPVPGMAKNIDAEGWDQLLKEFFLT